VKSCSFFFGTGALYASAMLHHDLAYQIKTNPLPRAGVRLLTAKAALKHALAEIGRDPGAIIADTEPRDSA
jgi:hypothetical protein